MSERLFLARGLQEEPGTHVAVSGWVAVCCRTQRDRGPSEGNNLLSLLPPTCPAADPGFP